MNRTELFAIGAGLVAGYLLIMYLNRRETAAAAAQRAADADVPEWARGDKTLTEIWQSGF